jgi:hypothetical protein
LIKVGFYDFAFYSKIYFEKLEIKKAWGFAKCTTIKKINLPNLRTV